MSLFDGLEDQLTDPLEREVAAFVAERADEVLEFARELIRTPSVNPPGDEREVASVLVDRLARLGVGNHRIVAASDDRPNVLAHVDGTRGGSTMMLSGHIDTKPPGDLDAWHTDPHDPVIDDGRLYGLGSGDMKVAIAAMVYAAAALQHVGDFPGRLALALTADEENGSAVGSKWLAEEGLIDADVCVIGEPGGVAEEWESIHLVSRGAALFRVVVHGTQLHSSISDQLPTVNATLKMAELALRMQRELKDHLTFDDHPYCRFGPTVNIGMTATAGVTYGVFPGRAEFASDIRMIPGMTARQVRSDVQAFVDRAMEDDSDLRAELVWDSVVVATEIEGTHPVVDALRSSAEAVLGHTPRLDAFPGATDAAYLQTSAGVPCVASFGPGLLPRAHSPNEWLFADGAARATMIYALSALRYLRTSA